jgi:hypothetical protein
MSVRASRSAGGAPTATVALAVARMSSAGLCDRNDGVENRCLKHRQRF